MKIVEYDTTRYYFADLVGSLYDVDLADLDNEDQKTNLTLGMDTHTSFHKAYSVSYTHLTLPTPPSE